MTSLRIGAHVDQADPLAEAAPRGRPRAVLPRRPTGLEGPGDRVRGGGAGAAGRRRGAGVDLYVHAPYVINVATTNNRIRIPSRKLLQQHVDGGGDDRREGPDRARRATSDAGDDPAVGFDNWRKTFERLGAALPGPHREHRRRRQRDGPPARRARPAVGRGRRVRASGSASTPATPTPAARSCSTSSTGSRRSPADRPRALQRLAGRLRLRRRPARQHRLRRDRPGLSWSPWSRGGRRAGRRRDAGRAPTARAPTSPCSASACRSSGATDAHRHLERQLDDRAHPAAARMARADRARRAASRRPRSPRTTSRRAQVATLGYEVAHHGEGRWNGVAILSRVGLDDVVLGCAGGPGFPDPEARAVAATCGGPGWSVYVPNGRGARPRALRLQAGLARPRCGPWPADARRTGRSR